MKIHERIRELREDHDLNQTQIAKILGIEQTYYSKYELGKHPLPITHLKTLCEYYGVSADYVLGLPEGLNWPRRNQREQLT